MTKIFFVRHQANGVVYEFPFAADPSSEQIAAVRKFCEQRHGFTHPKSGESYWLRIESFDVLGSEVPDVPDRNFQLVASEAAANAPVVSGTGTVS